MSHLAFLHTAPANEALFVAQLARLSPRFPVRHCTKPDLLSMAQDTARPPSILRSALERELAALRAEGAGMVACTCSTLGGEAESMGQKMGLPVLRIDRPMAEAAVAAGSRLLIAACVRSTVEPTMALLAEVAKRALRVETLVMEDLWPLFESGELAAYHAGIAARLSEITPDHDAIVLAQASMAAAAEELCPDLGVPIFSSPVSGTEAAVAQYETLTRAGTTN